MEEAIAVRRRGLLIGNDTVEEPDSPEGFQYSRSRSHRSRLRRLRMVAHPREERRTMRGSRAFPLKSAIVTARRPR
jgi:hypothetical protein